MSTVIGIFSKGHVEITETTVKNANAEVRISGLRDVYFVNGVEFECENEVAYIKTEDGFTFIHPHYRKHFEPSAELLLPKYRTHYC